MATGYLAFVQFPEFRPCFTKDEGPLTAKCHFTKISQAEAVQLTPKQGF